MNFSYYTLRPAHFSGVFERKLAVPLLGYFGSLISCLSILTSILLLLYLWPNKKPSNRILSFIEISNILTIFPMIPWWIYFYVVGYTDESISSVPLCYSCYHMNSVLPAVFHTASKLFTVYLAFQRWVHVRYGKDSCYFCIA